MMHRPSGLSAMGKARRRSSLLRPSATKSPRNTARRMTTMLQDPLDVPSLGALNKSRLAVPLPSAYTTGRATTNVSRTKTTLQDSLDVPSLGALNKSRISTPLPSAHTTGRATTSSFLGRQRQMTSSTSSTSYTRPQQQRQSTPLATRPPVASSRNSSTSTRPPVATSRPPSRSSAAPRPPSELVQLREKLAATEQQLASESEMSKMLKDNLELVRMQLEKATIERDMKSHMVLELKETLATIKENLSEREMMHKEVCMQLEEKEATMRSLHNDVVDLRGQIRVAIRVRPMLSAEKETSSSGFVQFPAVNAIAIANGPKPVQFDFEKVFTPVFSQKDIFLNIQDFILSALHGFNVGLIAFGQTGSGKTHTMRGGGDEEGGVIPRAGSFLFTESKKLEATGWKFEFSLSFLEIYNNEAYDLLGSHKTIKLRLGDNDVTMDGLSNHPLSKLSDLAELLQRADKNRKTASTKCNATSSRSHAVYMWNIKASQESTGIKTSSCLKLVDLAGSERAKESGATGQQFTEMTNINQSLSTLQKCIAMQRAKSAHVPYRESKLTQVLMDCLGRGNSKTMVIVNINPCNEQAQESKRSIEFAHKMRNTSIGAAVQQRDL